MPSAWLSHLFGGRSGGMSSGAGQQDADRGDASVLVVSPDPSARALLEALLGERVLRSIERSDEARVYLRTLGPRAVVQHTPSIEDEAQFICQDTAALAGATKVVHLLPPGISHLPCGCPEVTLTLPYSPLALLDELDGIERDGPDTTVAA